VAASGGELLWLIIVVITIIAQLSKARKSAQGRHIPEQQKPESAPRPRRVQPLPPPEDELRKFLEDLGKAAGVPLEQLPPPASQPKEQPFKRSQPLAPLMPAQPPISPAVAAQQEVAPLTQNIPPARESVLPVVDIETQPVRAKPLPARPSSSAQSRKGIIRNALRSRDSIRSAILLKEIIGPPLAFRAPAGLDYLDR